MNWAMFSLVGYVSIGLWLCIPLLWLLHEWRRPRRWLCHAAVVVGVTALVLATINSRSHVSRIRVDRSEQIESRMSQQEIARQAAEKQRAGEVAGIRFAEDAAGDYLDMGGLNDADRAYFESFDDEASPVWKQQKKQRSEDSGEDAADLESMIGGAHEQEGLSSDALPEEQTVEPILMSDAQKHLADRVDAANLTIIRLMLLLGVGYVVFDYVRRLNIDGEAYFPLPIPSRWADAATPRQPIESHGITNLSDDLQALARRGEVFIYMTDDGDRADRIAPTMPRLPAGLWPVGVVRADAQPNLTDEFIFETLWFGRNCFVVDSADRAEAVLDQFVKLLGDRRRTRARTRQMVHVIWDVGSSIPDEARCAFAKFGPAAGVRLVLCEESRREEQGIKS